MRLIFIITSFAIVFASKQALACDIIFIPGMHEHICIRDEGALEFRFQLIARRLLEDNTEVWDAEIEEILGEEESELAVGDVVEVHPFGLSFVQSDVPLARPIVGYLSGEFSEPLFVQWAKLLSDGEAEEEFTDGEHAVTYSEYQELRLLSQGECIETLESRGIPPTEQPPDPCGPFSCAAYPLTSAGPLFLLLGFLGFAQSRRRLGLADEGCDSLAG